MKVSYDPIIGFNALARVATSLTQSFCTRGFRFIQGFWKKWIGKLWSIRKRLSLKKNNYDFVNEVEVNGFGVGSARSITNDFLINQYFRGNSPNLVQTGQEPQSVVSISDAKRLLALL